EEPIHDGGRVSSGGFFIDRAGDIGGDAEGKVVGDGCADWYFHRVVKQRAKAHRGNRVRQRVVNLICSAAVQDVMSAGVGGGGCLAGVESAVVVVVQEDSDMGDWHVAGVENDVAV